MPVSGLPKKNACAAKQRKREPPTYLSIAAKVRFRETTTARRMRSVQATMTKTTTALSRAPLARCM